VKKLIAFYAGRKQRGVFKDLGRMKYECEEE